MDTVDVGTSASTIAATDQPAPSSELPEGPGCEQEHFGVAGSTQAGKLDRGCGGSDEVSMQVDEAEARESGGGWPMEGIEMVRPGSFSD